MRLRATTVLAGLLPAATLAQGFDLSVRNLMRGPEHYGREPANVRWHADGSHIYFDWLPPGSPWDAPLKPHRVRPVAGAAPEEVAPAHVDSVAPQLATGALSPDGRQRLVAALGDVWLVDARTGAPRRLTRTAAPEGTLRWGVGGRRVFFQRDGNAFAVDLATGLTEQLTDLRVGTPPAPPRPATGQRGALEKDQRDLLAVIRDRVRADSLARAEREARDRRLTGPVTWIEPGWTVTQVDVAPTGTHALLTVDRQPTDAKRAEVPNYVTADGYAAMIPTRSKVGDAQAQRRIGLLRVSDGAVTWLRLTPADTARAPSQANAIGWNASGTHAAVFAVTSDFATRYLHTVRADSAATVVTVDVLVDSAWTNGPCFGCAGWADDATLWFVSEASGFAHLYTVPAVGGTRRALTEGRWEVLQAELSPDRRWFWLHTSEGSPYVRHFWRVDVATGRREQVTPPSEGGYTVTMAPDGVRYAATYSTANRPPELFSGRVGAPALARHTTSPTAAWLAGPWIVPAIVEIPASDGARVPARIYRPQDLGARPNGAAVIFVHGAGYLHNVHSYWSSYAREYLFHHLLASRGYVVLDLDYRASAGYGRDWRTAIDRWMGGRDLADHVDASAWLAREFGVPPERVGIYGGSYGGFITLMALFTAPKAFGAGAALRPVTDWAHYNHGYTGRILNLPQSDTLAYRRSSPIFHAEGLEDPLLILHGMVDVNVHYQDVVRLTQRLIELYKTDWELASYPVEDHGFVRPDSWTDEYRRILELFERTIGPDGSKARR